MLNSKVIVISVYLVWLSCLIEEWKMSIKRRMNSVRMIVREKNKNKNNWISNLDLKIQNLSFQMKSVAMKTKQKQGLWAYCLQSKTKYTYYIRAQLPLLSHFWYLRKNKQKKNKSWNLLKGVISLCSYITKWTCRAIVDQYK